MPPRLLGPHAFLPRLTTARLATPSPLKASTPLSALSVDVSVGGEWRRYLDDDRLELARPDGSVARLSLGRHEERRVFTGELVAVRLSRRLSLLFRHELVVNDSSATGASGTPFGGCGRRDPSCGSDARSYRKNVLTAGAALAW